MKISPIIYVILLITMGCRKEPAKQIINRPVSATVIVPTNPVLTGVLGTGHNVKDTIYLNSSTAWSLSGMVYVDSADVLQCECGCTIKAFTNSSAGPAALVVARGGKVIFPGSAGCPIVFTSGAASPQPGDWGGIIIVGNAPSNHTTRTLVEGIDPSTAPPVALTYGGLPGTDVNDNSGVMTYVRIEYAGYAFSTSNRIHGLMLAGVGNGTTINFVETYKTAYDGFHFYGGTVNASHLIAADAGDDLFETGNGYTGTLRYVLGLIDTSRADQGQSDGLFSENNSTNITAIPVTKPVYRRMTIIGVPNSAKATNVSMPPSGTGRYGRAAHFRNNTGFDIDSAIFLGFNFGVSLDSTLGTTPADYRANHITRLKHTVSHAYFNSGSPTTISRYITEGAGSNPATGIGFAITTPDAFYNLAVADGNYAASTVVATGVVSPFARTPAGLLTSPLSVGTTIAGGGAFPNNTTWVTTPWGRL